jgi:hypothetical protein
MTLREAMARNLRRIRIAAVLGIDALTLLERRD